MSKNYNTNNQQGEKELLHLTVEEPAEFASTIKSRITTTERLAKEINKLFTPVFEDYYGCIINPANNLEVSLYFKPHITDASSSKYKAIEENNGSIKKDSGFVDKLDFLYGSFEKKSTFKLTDEGAQILYDFYAPTFNGYKNLSPLKPETFIKQNLMTEIQDKQYSYSMPSYLVLVSGLNINKLLSKIYGEKDDKNSRLLYQVLPVKPLIANPNNTNMANANWIVTVQCMDSNEFASLAAEVGMTPVMGGVPIVTGC